LATSLYIKFSVHIKTQQLNVQRMHIINKINNVAVGAAEEVS